MVYFLSIKNTLKVFPTSAWLLVLSVSVEAERNIQHCEKPEIRAKVAIIIDDLGYGWHQGRDLVSLPHDLTLAIIPDAPYAKRLAELAHENNREIMLHAPMETLDETPWESGLTGEMDETQTVAMIDSMLVRVPHVAGVNNHGGSKLTQDLERMRWVMAALKQRNLYFIDSRTIATSRASQAASEYEVSNGVRDVFLDNTQDYAHIVGQLRKLETIAQETGYAIGIGHPYQVTRQALLDTLPRLEEAGVVIVSVSELLLDRGHTQATLLAHKNIATEGAAATINDVAKTKRLNQNISLSPTDYQ